MSDTGPCYCSECSSSILKRTRAQKSTHWPWGSGLHCVCLHGRKKRISKLCVMDRFVGKCTDPQTQVFNLAWVFYIPHCHSKHLGNISTHTKNQGRLCLLPEELLQQVTILQPPSAFCSARWSHLTIHFQDLRSSCTAKSWIRAGAPLSSESILQSTAFIITADGTVGANLPSQQEPGCAPCYHHINAPHLTSTAFGVCLHRYYPQWQSRKAFFERSSDLQDSATLSRALPT